MHSKANGWLKPNLRRVNAERLYEQGWKREQLLEVRALVEKSMVLLEADGTVPEAVVKLRSLLAAIDTELASDGD